MRALAAGRAGALGAAWAQLAAVGRALAPCGGGGLLGTAARLPAGVSECRGGARGPQLKFAGGGCGAAARQASLARLRSRNTRPGLRARCHDP